MPLRLEDKKALVAEVNEVAKRALSAVAAENRGLTAGKFDDLREQGPQERDLPARGQEHAGAQGGEGHRVSSAWIPALVGPLVLGFSLEDPGAVGRVIKDFAKDNDKLVVKAVAVGGTLYGAKDIDRLASLPTKEQALAMLLGTMMAPISKFVTYLERDPTPSSSARLRPWPTSRRPRDREFILSAWFTHI